MIKRHELEKFLKELLLPDEFDDYCPNGLQVEGNEQIKRIAFAVSATRESITKSMKLKVDTLIVHHGLFWKFHGPKPIVGPFAGRIIPLIRNNINLFAYHLPLDANQSIGNAKCLADSLNLKKLAPFGEYNGNTIGIQGIFKTPLTATELKKQLENILSHNVIMATPNINDTISSIGIVTGGANNKWEDAVKSNLDAYLTGEISEHNWHESKEAGIHMFAGGHNATEKFGIQTLMNEVEKKFKLECFFIDSTNPA